MDCSLFLQSVNSFLFSKIVDMAVENCEKSLLDRLSVAHLKAFFKLSD